VADATGTTVWRWDQAEPFGSNPPDENPSGLGAFDLPLRLPGQRYDAETALHYNYFRDYDPSLGRYGESDPVGLKAGLNTYAYVGGSPLTGNDPFGLATFCCRSLNAWPFKRHCYLVADDGTTYGMYPGTRAGVRVGIPQLDDPRDRGGDCFDCPKLDCGPDQDSCLRSAYRSYPIGAYKELGPNSNTYAGSLARQCCKGGVPAGVRDAPGIDSLPPSVRVPLR
jgi:RHS repeat-associated protein